MDLRRINQASEPLNLVMYLSHLDSMAFAVNTVMSVLYFSCLFVSYLLHVSWVMSPSHVTCAQLAQLIDISHL